ncbi:MAG TPA: hypothetical protein VK445_03290 [Dissulfurispiraceae bacterium]|nr:hypothetical protein [Dissulfurispiraceae bacterium]
MPQRSSQQELYHEIFGSVLDRTEMTPYLLLHAQNYRAALANATKMMGNRGFDTLGTSDLRTSERNRAQTYIRHVYSYFLEWLFPFVNGQLFRLTATSSPNAVQYRKALKQMRMLESLFRDDALRSIIDEDPRHLFLLASSRKYPDIFLGYKGLGLQVPPEWQQAACAALKMGHLIKAIEEDSQDINDYAQLGFFLEMEGQSLNDLYHFNWENPEHLPDSEAAQRAFVKVSTFFHKLKESMSYDSEKGCLVFDSGDGVRVAIAEVKARLKSPESMCTKLGKDLEGEAHEIRDILAITFLLKSREDTLTLFHALQKRGVILQENTVSHSITQTLFDSPDDMIEAVLRLMIGLAQSEGIAQTPTLKQIRAQASHFFEALSINTRKNRHSSDKHRKIQCKINFSLPVHRTADTNRILIPGTPDYAARDTMRIKSRQHTLSVELRISDMQSWQASEQKGESHHDAYKFRQLISLMNRIFNPLFSFPKEAVAQLRKDQAKLFS